MILWDCVNVLFFLPNGFSIHWWYLYRLLFWWLQNSDFSNSIISSAFTSWHSAFFSGRSSKKKSILCFNICVYVYVCTHTHTYICMYVCITSGKTNTHFHCHRIHVGSHSFNSVLYLRRIFTEFELTSRIKNIAIGMLEIMLSAANSLWYN